MQVQSKKKSVQRWRKRLPVAILGVAVIGAVAAVASVHGPARTSSAEPPIPHLVSLASWAENGQDGQYVLQIADGGAMPTEMAVSGTVTTDTNCAPDALGLSHCRNDIQLSNGDHIIVIDTHMMSRNPCLEPGEALTMKRINSAWLVATAAVPRRT